MGIPERLVEVREKNGYTRKRLAEELGKPYATITKYENGEREAGSSYLIEIAQKFHVTIDYLLGLSNDPNGSSTQKENSPTPDESEVEEIEKWLTDLLVDRGYIRSGEDISNRDADFLIHWIGLLDAWFEKE